MAELGSGRFAGCRRCGALYVHEVAREVCAVCGEPHPDVSVSRREPVEAPLAQGQSSRTPERRGGRARVVVGAAATWAVLVAVVVWATL